MSSDVATIDLETGSETTDFSSSGPWREGSFMPQNRWGIGKLAQIAGLILAIAASPSTAITDYWFLESRRRNALTASWVVEGMIGRPISRTQALRIARQVMERAERERLELADWEAKRGIQWEQDL